MTGAAISDAARYRAFISYSHKDAPFASRLHRRLEGYVLPKSFGPNRRLTPIFKDRAELPAAHDLSAQVRAALERSDCLIVVCSPRAASSRWVGQEIETFRQVHPHRQILTALVEGPISEAFPPALLHGGVEPLAADFRPEGDGARLALLKLAAGIAGVGVDRLVQRDAQRRLRGVMAVTVVALLGVIAMGLTTAFAMSAKAEAERQRREAESLVEFMLTDLRDRLLGVGRLDVQGSVNRRALDYYGSSSPTTLSPDSLQRRARLLHAVGEDEVQRGHLNLAKARFDEAYAITRGLMLDHSRDPAVIFAHAQSEHWLGYVAFLKSDMPQARSHWEQYRALADLLVRLEPNNAAYRRERAFAEGDICVLATRADRDPILARNICGRSIALMTRARATYGARPEWQADLANLHGWMAEAHELGADLPGATRERLREEELLTAMMHRDPGNMKLKEGWIGSQKALARLAFLQRDLPGSLDRMLKVRNMLAEMTELEPTNEIWRSQLSAAEQSVSKLKAQTSGKNR